MKGYKKALALLLAGSMVALTACGGGGGSSDGGSDSGGSTSGGGGTPSQIEVKIWDNNQLAGLQQIADEWTEQSGIKVNMQVVDWNNYWTLLEAGASGGDMPDVFWMHSNTAEMYMSGGKLLDLTDYIANSDKIDISNYYEGITELYSKDGKNYAVPKDHDTIALIYNKAIFDKYGVDYPTDDWTWDDFYAAGKAITDASNGDVYGAAMNTGNNQDSWYNIVYDYGGYVISDDKKTSGWDDPNTKKAMEFVGKLCSDVFPAQSVMSETGTDVLFTSGKAAMITQGSWMILQFYQDENADNFAWSMLPYYDANGNGQADGSERCSIYNGLGWAASADTQYPDACWDLIQWFSTKEMQEKQAELGVTMAGYKGVSDKFANAFEGMDVSAFQKIEDEGTLVFRPYSKYTTRWEDAATQELVAAWNDPSQMDSILDKLASDMNATLANE